MWFLVGMSVASGQTHLSGKIVEISTDLPVSATIMCGDTTITSDLNGHFEIVDPECSELHISSRYHRSKTVKITADLVVYLQPLEEQESILVQEDRSVVHGRSYAMQYDELQRTPGGFDDPIRLLQSLPGVVATREYGPNAGDVILRGAAPYESRLYIDGVEVPYLYHFQQYASILHTKVVDNVSVHPSNYGATYGDSVGGIVNIESKEPSADGREFSVNGNLIMTGIHFSTPVQNGVFSISARRSYADLYESGNEQYSLWPVFSDYVGRFDLRNDSGHHFRLTSLGAMDKYGRYILDADVLDPYEREVNPNLSYKRRFDGGVFRWDWRKEGYRIRTSVALIRDNWQASVIEDRQQRIDNYSWIRHESIWLPNDHLEISSGFDQRLGRIQRDVETAKPYPLLTQEAPLLGTPGTLQENEWEWRQGLWFEPRWTYGKWRLISGVRYQSMPLAQDFAVDPRLQVHYEAKSVHVHAGLGRYHQSPPVDISSVDEMTVSTHFSTGVDQRINDVHRWGLDLWLRDSPNTLYAPMDGNEFLVPSRAYGGELFWNADFHDELFSRLSISSTASRLDGGELSPFDQPFSLNALLSWQPGSWSVGARYRYSWGLPISSPIDSYYMADLDQYRAVWETYPSRRMPNYSKIDVHIEREWTLRDWSIFGYCESWYVPASGNYLYPIYNYNYQESQLVVGPAFVPLVGLRVER